MIVDSDITVAASKYINGENMLVIKNKAVANTQEKEFLSFNQTDDVLPVSISYNQIGR